MTVYVRACTYVGMGTCSAVGNEFAQTFCSVQMPSGYSLAGGEEGGEGRGVGGTGTMQL